MTVLGVLGQETQAGGHALLGALARRKAFSTWRSLAAFTGVWTWRVVEGHIWFSQMSNGCYWRVVSEDP